MILNDTSIKAEQPNIKIDLKPHQLTSLYTMKQLDSNYQLDYQGSYVRSNIGILADIPGSGKTLTMLSLIASLQEQDIENIYQFSSSFGWDSYGVNNYNKFEKEYIKTNLIVVSSNLIKQWEEELEKTFLSYETLDKNNYDEILIGEYDVVLCPSVLYNKLITITPEKWNRIVVDEADSISIPNMKYSEARFLWIISSTYKNLSNIKRGFLGKIFYRKDTDIFNNIVIFNDPEYTKKSFNLLEPKITTINCTNNEIIETLNPYLSKNVKDCLNAGDTNSAILMLGGKVDTDSNILHLVTKQINNEILKIKSDINLVQTLEINDKHEKCENLQQKLKVIETKRNGIIERVKSYSKTNCPICLDPHNSPTISTCCNNVFCGFCLLHWTEVSKSCPVCKQDIVYKKLYTIHTESLIKKEYSKIQAIKDLLLSKPKGRFLIFSQHSNCFKDIGMVLKEMNVKFGVLTPSRSRKSLEDFKKGDLNVILLNSNHYGAGINIPEATDIILFHQMKKDLEYQCIGRAQRPGRISQLNILKLRFQNEND